MIYYDLEPIIYYINYIYGKENFFSDLTRNSMFSNATETYLNINIESPELVDDWGIHSFILYYNFSDPSHYKFKVVLYVDYRYIHKSMKHQESLKNKCYPYDISVQYIYIDKYNLDLSNYYYLYYVIDSLVLYRIDFLGKEVRVVTSSNASKISRIKNQNKIRIDAYHYFSLLNHNASFYSDITILDKYLLFRKNSGESVYNSSFMDFINLNRSLGENSLILDINPNKYYKLDNFDFLNILLNHHHPHLSLDDIYTPFDSLNEFISYLNNLYFVRTNIFIRFLNPSVLFLEEFNSRVRGNFPVLK